ncbi:MAG: glycerol-3-phosphate dehydrogenase subunit GlpB [Propionibacteriaceae bacterium]|jgi:glycerol-3-phosphate dehydrogenase subunit B|nr:glycerol-3-phosphate dehydrogenase subunit GlpB [Propionibacteriaceae bacterium]
MSRAIVIGAGLGGLASASNLARQGLDTTLISQGLGGLQLGAGTVDILGYDPEPVADPLAAVGRASAPHPYSVIGPEAVRAGVEWLRQLLGPELLVGQEQANVWLPTAVGALRPTALFQPSMAAGQARAEAEWLIVGLSRLKDFSPALVAGNLNRTDLPTGGRLRCRPVVVDLEARPGEADSSGLTFARALDRREVQDRLIAALRPELRPGQSVGLPAVLGLNDHSVHQRLSEAWEAPVFEIPLPPPSVPGMRLNQALTAEARAAGVRFVNGSSVIGFEAADGRLSQVVTDAAGHPRPYSADVFVYAPGGFESGALTMDSYYQIKETVFDLPLHGLDDIENLITGDHAAPQPVFAVGLGVDAGMRPVDSAGAVVYENLHAVGSILAGAIPWHEKSGEGIALGSAWAAVQAIQEELK